MNEFKYYDDFSNHMETPWKQSVCEELPGTEDPVPFGTWSSALALPSQQHYLLMLLRTSIFLLALAPACALELTAENWDELTAGKTLFVKFFASWCGHCKAMKPDWDKLMETFADSDTALVADVECTAEGESLCEAHGIRGYPDLKYGPPEALEDYEGARDYETLEAFAKENLKPMCSPSNIDLCDDEKKAEIQKFQVMSDEDLGGFIGEKSAAIEKLEENFEAFVEGLQTQYEEEMNRKDAAIDEVKKAGLGLAKAVKAAKNKIAAKADKEL